MSEYKGLPMTPVDEEPRAVRGSSGRYTDTIKAFWSGDPITQAINFREAGIKGQTLRVGLLKAIDDEGLTDKVKVSIHEKTGLAYLTKVE